MNLNRSNTTTCIRVMLDGHPSSHPHGIHPNAVAIMKGLLNPPSDYLKKRKLVSSYILWDVTFYLQASKYDSYEITYYWSSDKSIRQPNISLTFTSFTFAAGSARRKRHHNPNVFPYQIYIPANINVCPVIQLSCALCLSVCRLQTYGFRFW